MTFPKDSVKSPATDAPSKTSKVVWSMGFGDIGPTKFQVIGKPQTYCLEMMATEAGTKLKDGEVVVSRVDELVLRFDTKLGTLGLPKPYSESSASKTRIGRDVKVESGFFGGTTLLVADVPKAQRKNLDPSAFDFWLDSFEIEVETISRIKTERDLARHLLASKEHHGNLGKDETAKMIARLRELAEKTPVGIAYDLSRGDFDVTEPNNPDIYFLGQGNTPGAVRLVGCRHLHFDWSAVDLMPLD